MPVIPICAIVNLLAVNINPLLHLPHYDHLCTSSCGTLTGAIALQTSSFPLSEDQYTVTAVEAVVSVNCVGSEAGLCECTWTETNIDTDNRCLIDQVAEVVCQGITINWMNCFFPM